MKRTATLIAATLAALAFPIHAAFAPCHSVEFSPTEYTVGEAAGKVTLTVTNGGGAQSEDMMVDYATADGTAKAPADYTSKSGTVTWTMGASADVTIDVPIKNDSTDEPNEQFIVKLSNVRPPSSCVPPPQITGDTATVTIRDDDPAKVVPKPTKTQAPASSPAPSSARSASPSPTPSRSRTASPSPSSSPSPSPTLSAIAAPDESSGGGLSGGALAGIVAAVLVLGGGGVFFVRRRFLS